MDGDGECDVEVDGDCDGWMVMVMVTVMDGDCDGGW